MIIEAFNRILISLFINTYKSNSIYIGLLLLLLNIFVLIQHISLKIPFFMSIILDKNAIVNQLKKMSLTCLLYIDLIHPRKN